MVFRTTSQEKRFLSNLSSITGISVEDLTKESFGSNTVEGIVPIVLAASIAVNAMVLLVLFLICVYNPLNILGH